MENRFKSLSLFEFQTRFPDEDKCREYLANLNGKKVINVSSVVMKNIVLVSVNMTGSAQVAII
jgi:hypothetical protein